MAHWSILLFPLGLFVLCGVVAWVVLQYPRSDVWVVEAN